MCCCSSSPSMVQCSSIYLFIIRSSHRMVWFDDKHDIFIGSTVRELLSLPSLYYYYYIRWAVRVCSCAKAIAERDGLFEIGSQTGVESAVFSDIHTIFIEISFRVYFFFFFSVFCLSVLRSFYRCPVPKKIGKVNHNIVNKHI